MSKFDQMTGKNSKAGETAPTTAMVKVEEGADESDMAPTGYVAPSFSTDTDFEPGETSRPRLKLAQPLTQEVQDGAAKPGQWVLTGGEGGESEVVLYPLAYARTREYRVDDERMCSSPDALHGYGNPGGACKACPLAEWQKGADKNIPPQCTLQYNYVCWSETHQAVCLLQFKKTGQSAAQYFNTLAQYRGWGRFAIKLASKKLENAKKQTYFAPVAVATDYDLTQAQMGITLSGIPLTLEQPISA